MKVTDLTTNGVTFLGFGRINTIEKYIKERTLIYVQALDGKEGYETDKGWMDCDIRLNSSWTFEELRKAGLVEGEYRKHSAYGKTVELFIPTQLLDKYSWE